MASAEQIIAALGGDRHGMCPCPAHDDEKPSLHVTDRNGKLLFHCHAGCSQEHVIGALQEKGLWSVPKKAREAREREQWNDRQQEKRDVEYEDYRRLRTAYAILRAAGCKGVERPTAYLKSRGIDIVPEGAMLLSANDAARLAKTIDGFKPYPAMVSPVVNSNRLVGAQVTPLNRNGDAKLAGKSPKKKSYGPIKGGYVPLGEVEPDRPCLVGEGIESTLSAMQIVGLPGIATLGTAGMKSVNVPDCSEVIIAADNDDAGLDAAKTLAQRLADEGRTVSIVPAHYAGEDWNDALRKDGRKQLDELRMRLLEGQQVARLREVEPLGMQAFMDLQFPPRRYLLKPWLKSTSINMLDAQTGHGKTWLALSVGYAVASGKALLDWQVEERVPVLYVEGEMDGELLQQRLATLGPKLPADEFLVLGYGQFEMRGETMPDLGTPEGRDYLDRVIERYKIGLIILDSISFLVRSGVNNDMEDWREIQSWLLKHRARGRAIIYLHHHGRSGKPMGTSEREFALNTRIKMAEVSDARTETESAFKLEFEKARDLVGRDRAPLLAYLSTETGIAEWRREEVKRAEDKRSQIVELLSQGVRQTKIAKQLGVSRQYVSQVKREEA